MANNIYSMYVKMWYLSCARDDLGITERLPFYFALFGAASLSCAVYTS